MRFTLASIAAAAAALALARPGFQANKGINPDRGNIPNVGHGSLPPVPPVPVGVESGNVRRAGIRLPPLPSKIDRRHPPVNQTCNFLIQTTANETLGYIANTYNDFGEYGVLVPSQTGALEVAFTYSPDSPRQIDILATNNPMDEFPFVGGVIGFASTDDNFGSGNPNYAYIAGVEQLAPGSPAELRDSSFGTATGVPTDSESAIWIYDPKNQALTVQWVNNDRSTPPTQLLYANDFNEALIITGDADAFRNNFGATYPDVTVTCVPVKKVLL
ncbi:hypothetical protein FRC09_010705 [Ceratobasidium sp. 395]|nr:hypothetical protein FRC09_010705 [Ceratobasidium sp. 395]